MMEKRNQYALMDDPIMDEPADLHVRGTIPRGNGKVEFWMFNPPYAKGAVRMRCGICKGDMSGFRHCPQCFPDKKDVKEE